MYHIIFDTETSDELIFIPSIKTKEELEKEIFELIERYSKYTFKEDQLTVIKGKEIDLKIEVKVTIEEE